MGELSPLACVLMPGREAQTECPPLAILALSDVCDKDTAKPD